MRVWLDPGHGALLLAFAEEYDLELAWATTWVDEANVFIGPHIGLPDLPYVPYDGHPSDRPEWKYPETGEWLDGRPAVWLDDEFSVMGKRLRAQQDFLKAREGVPTLLHHVDPRIGLTVLDLSAVGRWLKENV